MVCLAFSSARAFWSRAFALLLGGDCAIGAHDEDMPMQTERKKKEMIIINNNDEEEAGKKVNNNINNNK